jgi:hypothetical protein
MPLRFVRTSTNGLETAIAAHAPRGGGNGSDAAKEARPIPPSPFARARGRDRGRRGPAASGTQADAGLLPVAIRFQDEMKARLGPHAGPLDAALSILLAAPSKGA